MRGDTHAAVMAAEAAFQHVAHTEFAADLPDVDRFAFVLKARVAGDDEEFREAR